MSEQLDGFYCSLYMIERAERRYQLSRLYGQPDINNMVLLLRSTAIPPYKSPGTSPPSRSAVDELSSELHPAIGCGSSGFLIQRKFGHVSPEQVSLYLIRIAKLCLLSQSNSGEMVTLGKKTSPLTTLMVLVPGFAIAALHLGRLH